MYIALDRVRVKTEASFTVEDPWNQNRRVPFTVEDYVYVAKGTTARPNVKPSGDFVRGIRSDLDGVERILPDSLSELWRMKRVPAEALPRLLKEMEPNLKRDDYRIVLHNKSLTVVLTMFLVVIGLLSASPLWFVATGDLSPLVAIPLALGSAGIGWLEAYLIFYRKKWRRVEQMNRILARL